MTDDFDRQKKDRSPSFPFISLRKAVERADQFLQAHKRDAARLPTVAPTWGYGTKSSGLLQTVATLKQYGLLEDMGSGEDRKVRLTDLARRILSDTRPGVKEAALLEAAKSPKLFSEYIERWVPDSPADSHCISELEHDRGFTPEAAKAFLKSFKLTVSYAGLMARDGLSAGSAQSVEHEEEVEPLGETQQSAQETPYAGLTIGQVLDGPAPKPLGPAPFNTRCKIEMTPNALGVTAILLSSAEVDVLIRILEANKALLGDAGMAPLSL